MSNMRHVVCIELIPWVFKASEFEIATNARPPAAASTTNSLTNQYNPKTKEPIEPVCKNVSRK